MFNAGRIEQVGTAREVYTLFRPNRAPVVTVVAVVLVLVSILPVWPAQRVSGADAAGIPDASPWPTRRSAAPRPGSPSTNRSKLPHP